MNTCLRRLDLRVCADRYTRLRYGYNDRTCFRRYTASESECIVCAVRENEVERRISELRIIREGHLERLPRWYDSRWVNTFEDGVDAIRKEENDDSNELRPHCVQRSVWRPGIAM